MFRPAGIASYVGSGVTGQTMRHRPSHPRGACIRRRRKAFALFESLLAAFLVAVAATAFCSALVAGTTQNQSATQHTVATNLAAGLMNEIVSRRFQDAGTPPNMTPGPETGETSHSTYDNVDDYHGLMEAAGQMFGADGTALSDPTLAGFSRSATAAYVNPPGYNPLLPPAFILVTVEVKYNGASLVTLRRLISSEERS
jgi:hypothetical protein